MREAGVKEGLPAEAIGCMTTATIEGTETLMKSKQTAVILATGGIGLVRAAYSSGKFPALSNELQIYQKQSRIFSPASASITGPFVRRSRPWFAMPQLRKQFANSSKRRALTFFPTPKRISLRRLWPRLSVL
jgi:hypothetical protein